jgi:anaerobic dimethyl sulfoxide reductase subunit B (iron-sulfur subunit)
MENAGVKQLAFYFDSGSCSGCKACQAACKDRNDLPLNVLWRRVYEVAGGNWRNEGGIWVPGVFAYNMSLACNHCEKPLCLNSCPTGAIAKRPDGIVVIDAATCMGCRYCEWNCPYGSPQYDESLGIMTKCNFCFDLVEKGEPPACVSACPMRALDFGEFSELKKKYEGTGRIFPLPETRVTEPSLIIKPHKDAGLAEPGTAEVENWEEI